MLRKLLGRAAQPARCRPFAAVAALSLLLLVGAGGKTHAAFAVFTTPVGSTAGGQPVNAEADITTSAGQIQIVLKNLQANPTSVIQCISSFSFTLASPANLTGSSQTAANAPTINVNNGGTTTPGSTLTTVAAVGWVFTAGPPGLLNVLGAGGAGPANLIIGPPGAGGVYSNAGGSIAGNGPHNPFLNQTATFTITAPNVTAGTTIASVIFGFGTTGDAPVPGTGQTPEPATVITLVTGLPFGLLALRRRLRRQQADVAV